MDDRHNDIQLVRSLINVFNHDRAFEPTTPSKRDIEAVKVWIVQAAMSGMNISHWTEKLEKLDMKDAGNA